MNNSFNDNIELNSNETLYTMIKIILLLITLQMSRIILKQAVFIFFDYSKFNDILISMIIMIFFTLFIIYKSKREEISLDVFSYMKSKESKSYYILVTGCILLLIFSSPVFSTSLSMEKLITLIYSIVVIPIYEEIVFRSYIWNVLKKENKDELKIYLITTVLFSLYQIGYMDTIIMRSGFNDMIVGIFIKCSLMLSYGVFIGFFKYKIKNSYSCMLVHSFINIFGR